MIIVNNNPDYGSIAVVFQETVMCVFLQVKEGRNSA